jgi:hypothetical protein
MNNEPELITDRFGNKYWYFDEKLHREDGPAIEDIDGSKSWFLFGQFHRADGPAIEWPNRYKAWFLNGLQYSKEDWFSKLTSEQQYNFLWNLSE